MTRFWRNADTALMWILAAIFVSPVVLMLLTSLKPEGEVLNPDGIIPKHWTLINYTQILSWTEEAPSVVS